MTTSNGNGTPPPSERRTFVIHDRDGRPRTFVPAHDLTPAHRAWIFEQLRQAGLDQPDVADPDVLERRALESGRLFHLLGAVLVECGVEWTPTTASTNADLFAGVRDGAEKRDLLEALTGFLHVVPLLNDLR